jgi:hypothetical protein
MAGTETPLLLSDPLKICRCRKCTRRSHMKMSFCIELIPPWSRKGQNLGRLRQNDIITIIWWRHTEWLFGTDWDIIPYLSYLWYHIDTMKFSIFKQFLLYFSELWLQANCLISDCSTRRQLLKAAFTLMKLVSSSICVNSTNLKNFVTIREQTRRN